MYDDNDKSTGSPEKYTKEQFQKMEQERYAAEKRQNDERDKAIDRAKARKVDVLSLSNDDFGSKYGRDRTAKEVAMKNANDKAGYKEAEAENKREKAMSRTSGGGGGGGMPSDKMDKMKKMNYKSGGKVSSASKRADGCCIRGKTRA